MTPKMFMWIYFSIMILGLLIAHSTITILDEKNNWHPDKRVDWRMCVSVGFVGWPLTTVAISAYWIVKLLTYYLPLFILARYEAFKIWNHNRKNWGV